MSPQRPRVLLAEDQAELAKAVSRVLGLDCDVVGNVSDAAAVLDAAQRLQPDVIVLDLNLHNVNGLEVCRQIAHSNPQSKIIVFTAALDEPELRQRCLEAGAAAFVSKMPGDGQLLSTIKRLCGD
jgi:CheY-like chemotaxis protein